MYLPHFIATFSTLLTAALSQTSPPTNYGHWRLTLYETWAPSGVYSKTSTRSEYWTPQGTLGNIVYCADERIPDSRGHVVTPCNDTSFSCTLVRQNYPPETYLYEVRQTVNLGGERVELVGWKNMTKIRSGAGTTLQADDVVDAMRLEAGVVPV